MVVDQKVITVAHSPDSDDAFMFYALAKNKLTTGGLAINQVLKDIQSLNIDAMSGRYEVSAISFAAYPYVADKYALMPCGASMGFQYGPLVVAREPLAPSDLKEVSVAIPGKLTSAYLALRLFQDGLNVVELPFDRILDAVKSGQVGAGLIIHEGQLTYSSLGLYKVIDLGQWWYAQTALPLPLGGNVIRKDLGQSLIRQVTKLLQDSIVYSLEHRAEALEYALTYARDMDSELANRFVGMYVNERTVDYGDEGRSALTTLFKRANAQGLIERPVTVEFAVV